MIGAEICVPLDFFLPHRSRPGSELLRAPGFMVAPSLQRAIRVHILLQLLVYELNIDYDLQFAIIFA
jgi:hypothetical protein